MNSELITLMTQLKEKGNAFLSQITSTEQSSESEHDGLRVEEDSDSVQTVLK